LVDVGMERWSDKFEGWRRHWVVIGEAHLSLQYDQCIFSWQTLYTDLEVGAIKYAIGVDDQESDLPYEQVPLTVQLSGL
jgi:hypothetical protein